MTSLRSPLSRDSKKGEQNKLIPEWRAYQDRMNIPMPQEDRHFLSELLLRKDMVALQSVAQYGDELSRMEAFKAVARLGDEEELLGLSFLVGKVPIQWMEESYSKYSRELVKEVVVYNALSRLDSPPVADYIEGKQSDTSIPFLVVSDPSSITLPLEDVVAACVGVREEVDGLRLSLLVPPQSLQALAPIYSVSEGVVSSLISTLTLGLPNVLENPYHFANAAWISTRAPWLILTSSKDVQQALFQYFDCYRLLLLYGRKEDRNWLLERVDPVRTELATYFPSRD